MAAYTSPERVERDGFLIAFKGETMTETEARKRGLLGADESAPIDKPGEDANTGNDDGQLSKAQVKAELESRGIKYNSRTSEKKLRELLAEALAAEADANTGNDDGNAEGEAGTDGEDANTGNDDGNAEGEATNDGEAN